MKLHSQYDYECIRKSLSFNSMDGVHMSEMFFLLLDPSTTSGRGGGVQLILNHFVR